jgi:hypothetical protein
MKKILEPFINRNSSKKNENKFRKVQKILGRIGQHLNAFLKPFALKKHQDASA